LAQVIGKVGDLYTEVSGHHFQDYERDYYLNPERLLEDLTRGRAVEYRFGSVLTMDSKLWIELGAGLLRFRFDANMPVQSASYQERGKPMEDRFKAEINKYLLESGLGEPLPDYLH